ncbi:MAG: hypothetical protein K1060chlam2_01516 [Chlamydiae bacterium]|nr:hypothetical protein [Chlamydiota bacterium]
MGSIQNSTYIKAISYGALALITSRLLPGSSSLVGRLGAAGLAASITFGTDYFIDDQKDWSKTLLKAVLLLGGTTVGAYVAVKLLKGRVTLSLPAALTFSAYATLAHTLVHAGFSLIPPQQFQEEEDLNNSLPQQLHEEEDHNNSLPQQLHEEEDHNNFLTREKVDAIKAAEPISLNYLEQFENFLGEEDDPNYGGFFEFSIEDQESIRKANYPGTNFFLPPQLKDVNFRDMNPNTPDAPFSKDISIASLSLHLHLISSPGCDPRVKEYFGYERLAYNDRSKISLIVMEYRKDNPSVAVLQVNFPRYQLDNELINHAKFDIIDIGKVLSKQCVSESERNTLRREFRALSEKNKIWLESELQKKGMSSLSDFLKT